MKWTGRAMNYPTYQEIEQLRDQVVRQQNTRRPLLPFYSDILADMETPVSAYCKTVRRPYSFLLESVTGGEQVARFSFIGIDPYMVMIQRGEKALLKHMTDGDTRDEEVACHDPLELIEAELGQYYLVDPPHTAQNEMPKFFGGGVGYLSYESVARFERVPVPERNV